MSYALAVAISVLAGVVATLVGAGIWLVRRSLKRADDHADSRVRGVQLEALNNGFQVENGELRSHIRELESMTSQEIVARKTAERQRDELLDELYLAGDPGSTAERIRAELRRLSGKVPEGPEPEPSEAGGANDR